MNKMFIWALAAGATLFLGSKVAKAASKTQNLMDKIKFYPGLPQIKGLKDGFFNFLFTVQVMNQSAFDLSIDNLFVSVQYTDPLTKQWAELLTQNAPVTVKTKTGTTTVLTISKQKMNKLPGIPLSLPLTNAGVIRDLVLGKISPNLRVVTRFEYAGVELPAVEQMIDAKAMVAPLRTLLSSLRLLKGLGNTSIELA
jgi:hypothetical protein